jgi:Rieske Fe-S protein
VPTGWRFKHCFADELRHNTSMPNRSRKKKPARDFNQIARAIVDQATGETTLPPAKKKPARPKNKQDAADRDRADSEGMAQPQGKKPPKKNPAAVALGRRGGLKGGKARAAKLTKEQRSESARKAARARWGMQKGE